MPKAAIKAKTTLRSVRAGLQFTIERIHRILRKGNYAERLDAGAPVYLASVLEYLSAKVLELAGNAAKKNMIIPRHLQVAVENDDELNKVLGAVTIAQGGVLPNIQQVLLQKRPESKVLSTSRLHSKFEHQVTARAIERRSCHNKTLGFS